MLFMYCEYLVRFPFSYTFMFSILSLPFNNLSLIVSVSSVTNKLINHIIFVRLYTFLCCVSQLIKKYAKNRYEYK